MVLYILKLLLGQLGKGEIEMTYFEYYKEKAVNMLSDYNWENIVTYMDEEIAEKLHDEYASIDNLHFLIVYMMKHEKKYGDEFTL